MTRTEIYGDLRRARTAPTGIPYSLPTHGELPLPSADRGRRCVAQLLITHRSHARHESPAGSRTEQARMPAPHDARSSVLSATSDFPQGWRLRLSLSCIHFGVNRVIGLRHYQ